ncbi:TIR domain-containing protein [Stieleria bergensis]|uniref:TIR domain-containing protein n=1 Tax=Stieleria bergensis TaxID=2528025 RepID=UPI003AF33578
MIAEQLIEVAILTELPTDTVLISQEGEDTDLYFIISGRMRIEANGRPVAIRNYGTHVGEMALIDCKARRSASVIAEETTLVAQITEPDFTRIADEFPVLWRRISIELCDRLRNRNDMIRRPNELPNVFICSSSESLHIAEQIQLGLDHHESIVSKWTDQVFGLTKQTMEDLEREVMSADFAIAVVTGEDVVTARKKRKVAPRDNVVFELGLFMGQLGRERTVMVTPRGIDLKLPSDLQGLNPLSFTMPSNPVDKGQWAAAIGPVCTQLKALFDDRGPR